MPFSVEITVDGALVDAGSVSSAVATFANGLSQHVQVRKYFIWVDISLLTHYLALFTHLYGYYCSTSSTSPASNPAAAAATSLAVPTSSPAASAGSSATIGIPATTGSPVTTALTSSCLAGHSN